MLDVLLGNELRNVAVVVTRYFGGTLLGTGGLVRAYSGAVKAGLDASVIITKILGVKLHIETDYTKFGKIQYILAQRELKILDTVYTDKVELEVLIPKTDVDQVMHAITNIKKPYTISHERSCSLGDIVYGFCYCHIFIRL